VLSCTHQILVNVNLSSLGLNKGSRKGGDMSLPAVGGATFASTYLASPISNTQNSGGSAMQVRDMPANSSASGAIEIASQNARAGEQKMINNVKVNFNAMVTRATGIGTLLSYQV